MAQATAPADNVDFTSAQWRALFASRFADGILDPKANVALGYPLPSSLPASGNVLALGPGSSWVAGFLHQVSGTENVTIPAPSGGTTVYVVVVRYDPARTVANPDYVPGDPESPATLGVPCALHVLAGSPGGGAPTLTSIANGNTTQDFALYQFTRTVGGSIAAAARIDRRTWIGVGGIGSGIVTPDVGIGGAPPGGVSAKPGRRPLVTGSGGRVTVTYDVPFPTAIHSVAGLTVENTGAGAQASLVGAPTRTAFVASIRASNGAPYLAGVSVILSYTAWGY